LADTQKATCGNDARRQAMYWAHVSRQLKKRLNSRCTYVCKETQMDMKAYGSGYLAQPIQNISPDDAGPDQAAGKAPISPEQLRHAIRTAGVGGALAYCDVAIFARTTALVFRHIFFPNASCKRRPARRSLRRLAIS
jgi:hypothetical protein